MSAVSLATQMLCQESEGVELALGCVTTAKDHLVAAERLGGCEKTLGKTGAGKRVINFHRSSDPVRAVGWGVAGVVVRSALYIHIWYRVCLYETFSRKRKHTWDKHTILGRCGGGLRGSKEKSSTLYARSRHPFDGNRFLHPSASVPSRQPLNFLLRRGIGSRFRYGNRFSRTTKETDRF